MIKRHHSIPANYEVQPLKSDEPAKEKATCGYCGLSWDDGKVTSMTPAPSARCPFEGFHKSEAEISDEESSIVRAVMEPKLYVRATRQDEIRRAKYLKIVKGMMPQQIALSMGRTLRTIRNYLREEGA